MKFIDTFKEDLRRLKEWANNPPHEEYDWQDTDKIFAILGIIFIIIIFVAAR